MPVGIAMIAVVIIIGMRIQSCMPRDEHVVRPDGEAEDDDRQQREGHHAVAEDRFARRVARTSLMIPKPGNIMM